MGKRAWQMRRHMALLSGGIGKAVADINARLVLPDWPVQGHQEHQAARLHALCWQYPTQSTNETALALALGLTVNEIRALRPVVLELVKKYGYGFPAE